MSTESRREIRELKRKCRELEETIEVLQAATSIFARECDSPSVRSLVASLLTASDPTPAGTA